MYQNNCKKCGCSKQHTDILSEIAKQIEDIIEMNTIKFVEEGFTLDSINVYFHNAVIAGMYKAEIDLKMKD